MMRILIYLYLILTIVSYSCVHTKVNETSENDGHFVDLNIASYIENIDTLSSLLINDISHVDELLQLEATDSSLLSVLNMQLDSSMYGYIASCMNEPVMLFDHSGKHRYNLINIGRGPGETNGFLYKWQLNENILALSENMKFISVDLEQMVVTEHIFDKHIYNLFIGADDCIYTLVSLGPESSLSHFVEVYDLKFNLLSKVFNPDKKRLKYSIPNSFSGKLETNNLFRKYDGTILCKRAFNDTMYIVNHDGTLLPYSSWGRNRRMPDIESIFDLESNSKAIFIDNYAESKNYIFIKCSYNGNIYTIIVNKETSLPMGHYVMNVNEQSSIMNSPFFIDYRTNLGNVIKIGIINIKEDTLYCVVRSVDAVSFIADYNEDDNPVILKFRFK